SPSSQAEEVLKGCERAPGSHSAHSVRPSSRSPAAADREMTTPPSAHSRVPYGAIFTHSHMDI
ncbi:uncharacterized, partial [Tachysurus ichikawai]